MVRSSTTNQQKPATSFDFWNEIFYPTQGNLDDMKIMLQINEKNLVRQGISVIIITLLHKEQLDENDLPLLHRN